MLAISPQASEAIRDIAESADEPGAVVRIASEPETGLQIALVDGPEPDDVVVEDLDAPLAIEPTTALLLDDKLLDATIEDGVGVTFTVSDQASANGVPPASAD